MKFFAAGVVSLMVSLAFAEETVSPIEFIGTASAYNKNTAATDITNPAKWKLDEGVTELPSDRDYIIANGKYCGFGGDGKFPGKSLTLGVVGGASGNLGVTTAGSFDFGKLILNKGSLKHKVANDPVEIKADIALNAPAESPYSIQFNNGWAGRINLSGTIQGEGSIKIFTESQGKEHMLARVRSNMEGFSGIIQIGAVTYASTLEYRSPVVFGDSDVNGKIIVNPCGVVGPCGAGDYFGEFSVKKLSFHADSMIRIGVNATTGGTIRVTGDLELPENGKVGVDVTELPNSCLSGRRHPVLIAPAGSGIEADSFELKVIKSEGANVCGKIVACSLEVDRSSGCEILYLVINKYTCLKVDEGWGKSGWNAEYSMNWYEVLPDTPMSPDVIYINYYQQMTSPDKSCEFGGKKLVISFNDWGLLFACQELTIPDLVMVQSGQLRFWNQQTAKLYGKITLLYPDSNGYSMTLANARKYTGWIYSDIVGSGGIKVLGSNGRNKEKTDNPSATICLAGNNLAFSGRIFVTNVQNDPATNMTLRISDVKQLGGPMAQFTYNGLGFSNWSRFRADANLVLAEPTRGVFFSGGNYVSVPGSAHTLTLATQTTMAGTLVKEGAGTLALGGVLKFTKNQNDEPLEGTNILRVAEGCIKPASKSGADGLAIAFAAGTALALSPLAETDADVAQFGLYNEKWTEPFDLTDSDGKLEVKLDLPEDLPISFSFGVCTVSASAAESLRGKIALPKVSRYSCSISESSIEDGTVTFTATYTRPAFTISIR